MGHQNVFASDVGKTCRRFMELVTRIPPDSIYNSIDERLDRAGHMQVDIYIGGFPCTPFSAQGKGDGELGKDGLIAFKMIAYVAITRPWSFVFENVAGLMHRHTDTLVKILNSLLDIMDHSNGSSVYNISYSLMSTAGYGLPQHRERIYIVGIHKSIQKSVSFPARCGLQTIGDCDC